MEMFDNPGMLLGLWLLIAPLIFSGMGGEPTRRAAYAPESDRGPL